MLVVIFNCLEHLVDVGKDLFPSHAGFRRADEDWREFFPKLQYLFLVMLESRSKLACAALVRLRENDGERNAALAELDQEIHVDFSDFVSGVDQYEKQDHFLREVDVVADYLLQFLLACGGDFCVAITGQIDKISFTVDEKMVDKTRLAGL